MKNKKLLKNTVALTILVSTLFAQGELKSLEAQLKRERVRIDSLETHINILLPNLFNALKAADSLTKSMVASNVALINRINRNENKIQLLEDNAGRTDSTNFEILAKLVMIENKIVTLTNSFSEMYNLKSEKSIISSSVKVSPLEYKAIYIDAMSNYHKGNYEEAIKGFFTIVKSDPNKDMKLADNSQYWLAECYYSQKNYKRSITEFNKVSRFPSSDKDADAQLKLGHAFLNMGNTDKAKEAYQYLVDYYPDSEYLHIARETINQLTVE